MKLSEIAKKINAQLYGDPHLEIKKVASLSTAQEGDLSFFLDGKNRKQLKKSQSSAVILTEKHLCECPSAALVVDHPELAFANAVRLLSSSPEETTPGIHESAIVDSDTQIDPSVSIGPYCVIARGVTLDQGVKLSTGVTVGEGVSVGANTFIHPKVTIYSGVFIGSRVILHSGVVLGCDGFGLTRDTSCWVSIPQVGTVRIGDDVELGANTTIDRGALEDTVIENGVKIDNQVQIAHNVKIGAHTVIAGCTGIAGSAKIGRNCLIGGGVCINGHITVADGVVITGMAMVMHSIETPGIYSSGTGLQDNLKWRKSAIYFQKLETIVKRVKELERLQNE